MMQSDVTGCRVLVVEDETLIAILVEEILAEMGCQIVGPIAKLETALQTARDGGFDIAILDVTIRGGKVYPVAEELIARGVPFILASGYGDWALPPALREKRRLTKPFTPTELEEQVRLLVSEVGRSQAGS
ncbi:response regulator [Nitrobacter vulgaris]|uniref:Response regulator n=2 Tax=Nitrobacter vulgaris TaxID=29421 RepID=A0A1V4HV48_NITVU|nr:response regulator [Nitrobacter vulgaris]